MKEKILDFIYSKYQTDYYYRFGTSTTNQSFYTIDKDRLTALVELLPDHAKSVLDAGTGHGVLMNYFLLNNNYSNVVAIDKNARQGIVELSPYQDFKIMSVCKLEFDTNAFELVTCTEVLEHLPTEEQFNQALHELRRVSSKTLIVSLPFEEQEPLEKDHYHRFDLEKIKQLFPNGTYTILDHGNFKHIVIIEIKND